MQIYLLKLRLSNAYLILGDRPILVDSGSPGDIDSIRTKLRSFNVDFSDLALIVHTHVHSDHMGSTVAIATESNCSIAYHPADQPLADLANNGRLVGIGLRGKVMSRFFSDAKFDSADADVCLTDGLRLDEYGVNASIMATPGHTPGSVSIVTSTGDAIIGDVLMGGFIGGTLFPTQPNYHYFADNIQQAMQSLDKILSRTTGTLFVGHGGPLRHADVLRWRQSRSSLE